MPPKKPIKPFNLFVYGTLVDPAIFRAVLGLEMTQEAGQADGVGRYLARPAVLNRFTKISPDETYLYACPDPLGRINGYLFGPLPGECMTPLLKYEGRNYAEGKKIGLKDAFIAVWAIVRWSVFHHAPPHKRAE